MTNLNVEVTPAQAKVAHCAAKDNYRPVLAAVHITKDRISAADGFILAESKLTGKGDTDVLISAKELLKVKGTRYVPDILIADTGNGNVNVTGAQQIVMPKVEGSFPNIDSLYPKEDSVFQIALNASLLKKIVAMAGRDSAGGLIKFTFYGKEKPVKFAIPNLENEIKGVLMPMFAKWDD